MSGGGPQELRGGSASVPASDDQPVVPAEYSETYEQAYRRSLAEHPTEMMLAAARPGKRAAEQSGAVARLSALTARLLVEPRTRLALAALGAVLLIALAFVAGRLAAA